MRIAYLVNQYPKVSHSFIRREILGLEALGASVLRYSVRDLASELVDAADKQEFEQTHYLLKSGAASLLKAVVTTAIAHPIRFLQALQLAVKVGWNSDRGLLLHVAYLAEACLLQQWLRTADVSHLHVHFGTNSATVAMLCQVLTQIPYSLTIHGPEEFDKATAIALSEKIHRAAFIVAISSFTKSQLFRWCDYSDWGKIHVVRCGVDDLFLGQDLIALPSTPQFVCIGRLSEQKGHLLLIEAASQLAAAGLSFKLVFVGDGPLRQKIEQIIVQRHLEQHIEVTGWATNAEVRQHLLQSQVMVAPSFAEGLPVVIMEALALGRPVISTYIAGIPELVESGVNGWLVPAGDAVSLAVAMRQALHTPLDQLTQMGKNGRDRVEQHHQVAIEATKLLALFEKYQA